MQPLLEVQNLKKYFPLQTRLFRKVTGWVKAVDDVSFTIQKGEVVAIVGESGSGKSTTARAAIRLIEPTSGEIFFSGVDLKTLSQKELIAFRLKAQIVFQDPFASLNPRKTVLENMGEALFIHGKVKTNQEQKECVASVLKKVGLSSEVMHRYPHEFSGGQQQRICIGRALVLSPELLILDEAVSALDVSVQAQVLNLLEDLKEEFQLSYLFIAHDLSVVRHIADRVLVMFNGKIVEEGATSEIFSSPKDPYTKKLLAAIPVLHPSRRK